MSSILCMGNKTGWLQNRIDLKWQYPHDTASWRVRVALNGTGFIINCTCAPANYTVFLFFICGTVFSVLPRTKIFIWIFQTDNILLLFLPWSVLFLVTLYFIKMWISRPNKIGVGLQITRHVIMLFKIRYA